MFLLLEMYQSQSIPQFRRITFKTEKNQRMSSFPSVLTFRKGSMSTLLRECSYYATWMTSAENKHTLSQYRANGQTAYRRIFDFPCLLCAFIFSFLFICQMSCLRWEKLVVWSSFIMLYYFSTRKVQCWQKEKILITLSGKKQPFTNGI